MCDSLYTFTGNNNISVEILQDIKNGKVVKWKEHRLESIELSKSFSRMGNTDKYIRIEQCGSQLLFAECPNGHAKKLKRANFCRVRLCPMCSWRRSLMIFGQVKKIVHAANEVQKMRYIFLTLTTRNCSGDNLSQTLDNMFKAFNLLFKRKKLKSTVIGHVRALEVTHNIKDNTYHPHFHVLLGVKPSYFDDKYIKQSEWIELWQNSLNVDYKPIVDVRTVKVKKGKTFENVVAETAKYSVKPDDYLIKGNNNATDQAVKTLDYALKGRRLLGIGGLFRKLHKELNLADVERADLVKINDDDNIENCKCPICNSDLQEHLYRWNFGLNQYINDTHI